MKIIDWHQRAKQVDICVHHIIEGRQVNLSPGMAMQKYSPRDGHLLYELPRGAGKDMIKALKSSRQAYNDKRWRGLSLSQRQMVLHKLADLIETHQERLALYESLDVGKPITQALGEVMRASALLRQAVNDIDTIFSRHVSDGLYSAYELYKPVGLVGAIISWNYPLILAVVKAGPALIMGNCLVLKPSEHATLSATYLASLALEAGVPPGVFNVVNGSGTKIGALLAHHRDVDLVSFTGSSVTGKQIQIASGQSNMKRLLLECGGKSPYIVFEDCPADLDMLAADIVDMAFTNQSQNCMAGSRLLVQKSLKGKLLPKVITLAAQRIPRDPLDINTDFGAMIHEAHMKKVLAYIESARQEGANLILGGNQIQVDTGNPDSGGFYIEPTIFDDVIPAHKIFREEIFGPVLSVLTFDDEQEAIQLANDTCYGLAAYIATENMGRAQRLAQEINAGYLQIIGTSMPVNCYREIGKEGQKQSGYGPEGGLQGLLSYSVRTAIHQWV